MDSTSSLSQLLGISSKAIPIETWESLTVQVSCKFLEGPPSPTYCSCMFPFTLWASLLSSPILDPASFSPSPPLSHPGPSFPLPPMIIFFPLLSGIEASTFGPFCLLRFLWSVGCILGFLNFLASIHLSVRTCHVCPLGSGLPH